MGVTRGGIRAVFTIQGVLVASIGVLLGLALGGGLVALVHAVDYSLDASIYLIDELPVKVDVVEWVLVTVATLLCTVLATQYSAGRAAAKTPVEGLRAVD
jgi:lipoprotein-releasing system permease protein